VDTIVTLPFAVLYDRSFRELPSHGVCSFPNDPAERSMVSDPRRTDTTWMFDIYHRLYVEQFGSDFNLGYDSDADIIRDPNHGFREFDLLNVNGTVPKFFSLNLTHMCLFLTTCIHTFVKLGSKNSPSFEILL
jgi:hypothetical protein